MSASSCCNLRAGLVEQMPLGWRAVALADALFDALVKEAVHGFAVGDGVVGKFVAEVVEREFQALAHDARVGEGLGNVAEERGHLARRAQRPHGIAREQAAGLVERSVMADGREHDPAVRGLFPLHSERRWWQ